MALTYDAIASVRLTSQTNSITISNIPQTYTDLRVVFSGTSTGTQTTSLRFNGDSGTNYSVSNVQTNGGSSGSGYTNNANALWSATANPTASQAYAMTADIFSYTNNLNKQVLTIKAASRQNQTGQFVFEAGYWRNTAAITSINVSGSQNWTSGSVLTIYGILRA